MHTHALGQLQHRHAFHQESVKNEQRTRWVIWLTGIMMVAEIAAGSLYGSMALLADGWHMGTHLAALSLALFAYWYARHYAHSSRFSFGTGKVGALGGFASALGLISVAAFMGVESLWRLLQPEIIQFDQAMLVAIIGLIVNLVSAGLLEGGHTHEHAADSDHLHHQDPNLHAAYLHVLADALTSVLAIIALGTGKYLGWFWLDAIMGLVGGVLITRWGFKLLLDTSDILLDGSPEPAMLGRIQTLIESDADNRIADLHVWRVGTEQYAAIIALVTHQPRPPEHYRALLASEAALCHVTIEVHHCQDTLCLAPAAI